jgi:hypothetical protein
MMDGKKRVGRVSEAPHGIAKPKITHKNKKEFRSFLKYCDTTKDRTAWESPAAHPPYTQTKKSRVYQTRLFYLSEYYLPTSDFF